jgi:predicted acyltransferase
VNKVPVLAGIIKSPDESERGIHAGRYIILSDIQTPESFGQEILMSTASELKNIDPVEVQMSPVVPRRLVSLDAFRGWTMFWIVGGGSIVAGLAALGHNFAIDTIVYHLEHSQWQGLRYYDLIWPSFMLMTGMSLPFSYTKQILNKTHQQITLRVLKRVIILFLLGSIRGSVSLKQPFLIELSSALQPIAIAYFFAFLLVRKSWRFQISAAVGILVGYALLLVFVPAAGLPAGTYELKRNLVTSVDLAVLGRAHSGGWGTVLSTIPTIATTILGLMIGRLLQTDKSPQKKLLIITGIGSSCVIAGLVLNPIIPMIMKLWTSSYGLASAGWSCLIFALFYWIIDIRGARKWAFPFVVIGMNALAVYMGRTLIPLKNIVGIFTGSIALNLGNFGPLFEATAVLIVEWLILYWMYKRKIFLTA